LTPKIIGFETCRRLDEPIVGNLAPDPLCVPPAFVAPELLTGRVDRVGRPTDVYGLGAILYDLLTGQPPFVAPSHEETRDLAAHQLPIAPRGLEPSVPSELEAICLRALNKDPAKRFATAGAVGLELQRYLQPRDPSDDTNVDTLDIQPSRPRAAEAFQLRILSGPANVGSTYALSRQQTKIGRISECDVMLKTDKVSRLHCGVVWNEDALQHELVDFGGKNGTSINGERVKGNRLLLAGDLIQLPEFVLKFEASGA
jgi:serine/threonine protein kinase